MKLFNKDCLCLCAQSKSEQGVIAALSSNLNKDTAFKGQVHWLAGETNKILTVDHTFFLCDPFSVIKRKR